jgi:CBS domain-containing membrane protein
VAAVTFIPDVASAGAVAVGVAILAMFATRSLHPPGGAAALLTVLVGADSPAFALFPVAANSLVLLFAGVCYNRLTGRDYPHRQNAAPPTARSRFTAADLDAALAHYNQVLPVSRGDLAELLEDAEAQAYRRQLSERQVADIMTRSVITADYAMPLEEAWRVMRERHIKALPVIGPARQLIGIVTTGDFLEHAARDMFPGLAERMRRLVTTTVATHTDKPEVVGQIMTRRVRVVSEDRPLVDLLPLLAEGGHHHVPIVDARSKLVGIVTQTDLIRALHTATGEPRPAG